jgi:iron complex transport system ATP-binding protein
LSGEVLLEGKPLTDYSIHSLSRKLSIVLTRKPDVQNITVTEMVGLGRSPYTGFWGALHDADKIIVAEALRLVGIESMAERKIHTLSDGERQKVMIAKALAQQTPIILLDEPTAFLDFPSKVEILKLLGHLAKETDKTIILSTHDLELAARLADSLWQMDETGLKLVTPADVHHIINSAIEGTVVL